MALANIYQIFYDQKTKQALDPAFIPLDNTANQRPDWYEFWVIRNFLNSHRLNDDQFYGFVSPSFRSKTGIRGVDLHGLLNQSPAEIDVVLFSHSWDQIAYFRNVFEHGDYWHPGLMEASAQFFALVGSTLDLKTLVGHSMNSVFSNFFVAKPGFWHAWLEMADCLWSVCEESIGELTNMLKSSGRYFTGGQEAAMKVFVQERIASVILANGQFQTISLDLSHMLPVFGRLFSEDLRTRKLLSVCDTLKLEFAHSKDVFFRDAYEKCRSAVELRN